MTEPADQLKPTEDPGAALVDSPEGPMVVLAAVGQLATAAQQASLVHLGFSSGLLSRCGEWVTVPALASAIGATDRSVALVCDALVAQGALQQDGHRVRLSSAWMPLVQGGLDVMLRQTLEGAAVRQLLIEGALSAPGTYWELDAVERRRLAESVTLPTTTEFGRTANQGVIADVPGLDEELHEARWLELGCGVAGALLGALQQFPKMRAVALDVAPDLLDVARSRASELGVDDRVAFLECDARTYTDPEPFDLVFWSQFFFPVDTRKEALENAYARLRPGGLLISPVLPGVDDLPACDRSQADLLRTQQAALNALIIGSWDVPILSGTELTAEITAAGFTDVREHRGSLATSITARRK